MFQANTPVLDIKDKKIQKNKKHLRGGVFLFFFLLPPSRRAFDFYFGLCSLKYKGWGFKQIPPLGLDIRRKEKKEERKKKRKKEKRKSNSPSSFFFSSSFSSPSRRAFDLDGGFTLGLWSLEYNGKVSSKCPLGRAGYQRKKEKEEERKKKKKKKQKTNKQSNSPSSYFFFFLSFSFFLFPHQPSVHLILVIVLC